MKMPSNQYRNVIRFIKRADMDRVSQLRHVTHAKLAELAVARDLSKAEVKIPQGSDQVDVMSVIKWIQQIKPGEKRSIWQLIAIDATCVSRG